MSGRRPGALAAWLRLPEGDLWRDRAYARLWSSILTSSFGNQVMILALPLTAAVLLHATPTQMGLLTTIELAPFVTHTMPLQEINTAFDLMHAGQSIRSVVHF